MAQPPSRQIRVFISSTFKDMQAERDYLVKFIFPQLRKLCESRGVTWGEVDLRWGITEEQSAEGQVLPICLAEIERSRPYFIGLLGERYGWIPDAIDPELVEQEPWLAEHKEHSVTELEILHGVLNDPEMAGHALFYFRDPDYIEAIDESRLDDFIEVPWREDIEKYGMAEAQRRVEERKQKLATLKNSISQSGLPVNEKYRDPQQLGEWVLTDLTEIINQLYPEGEQLNPLAQEAMRHEGFAQSRARVYIGGEKYFAQLDAPVRDSKQPLVLTGQSGSGKSALLANWGLQYQEEHPDELVLPLISYQGHTSQPKDYLNYFEDILTLIDTYQQSAIKKSLRC